jgi:hypothetical protein
MRRLDIARGLAAPPSRAARPSSHSPRLAGSALAPTSTVVVTGGTELNQEKQQ